MVATISGQRGRLCPRNVIHTEEDVVSIAAGLREATSAAFHDGLRGLLNPYGDGQASEKIVAALLDVPLDRLLRKPLVEVEQRGDSLEVMTIGDGATLREAMEAIDRGGSQIAFVIDADAKLVGSLSDGDVRRALLQGSALDDAAEAHVTRTPIVATPDDEAQRVLELMEHHGITQIPVVEEGRLVGLHLMRALVSRALDDSIVRFRHNEGVGR